MAAVAASPARKRGGQVNAVSVQQVRDPCSPTFPYFHVVLCLVVSVVPALPTPAHRGYHCRAPSLPARASHPPLTTAQPLDLAHGSQRQHHHTGHVRTIVTDVATLLWGAVGEADQGAVHVRARAGAGAGTRAPHDG